MRCRDYSSKGALATKQVYKVNTSYYRKRNIPLSSHWQTVPLLIKIENSLWLLTATTLVTESY